MLDLKYLENCTEEAVERIGRRKHFNASHHIYNLLKINQKRKKTQEVCDRAAAMLNQKSKKVAQSLSQKDENAVSKLKKEILTLKSEYKSLLTQLKKDEENLNEYLLTVPNIPDLRVPEGGDKQGNEVVQRWGDVDQYSQAKCAHWELLDKYDLADFRLGAKITGSGFPVYKGQGAKLQRALISFFLDQALQQGYEEIIPPLLVNEGAAQGTGQLPDKEGLMYMLQDVPFYLIPTSEVPVTNLYSQSTLRISQLPIKHVAYTPCFRKEAGSWGTDVRGLNRLHQFDKVELVEVHHPSHSKTALEGMLSYVQGLLQKLKLPYRTLLLCTGDLGQAAAMTYDLEVWSAAQKKWLEVSSISLFNDYQARRMNLRYQEKENTNKKFCHTLNGSALALPRVLAALLENNQTQTGIRIPDVLHPYTEFTDISQS